jgi:hypothetical protein
MRGSEVGRRAQSGDGVTYSTCVHCVHLIAPWTMDEEEHSISWCAVDGNVRAVLVRAIE